MKILFLHGWGSRPGGVKPSYLRAAGHEVLNPSLPDDDFAESVRIAQEEYDRHRPQVIVGSSRGGAVALHVEAPGAGLVLLCPAWKRWGTPRRAPAGAILLHAVEDEVVPWTDSQDLAAFSGLPQSAVRIVGRDHRLADPEPLAAMLQAVESWTPGDEANKQPP